MSLNQNQWAYVEGSTNWYANGVETSYDLAIDPQQLPACYLTMDKYHRFYRMVICPQNHDVIHVVENNKKGQDLLFNLQLFLQSCVSMYEIEYLEAVDWLSKDTLGHVIDLAQSFVNDESALSDFLEIVDEAIDEDMTLGNIFKEIEEVAQEQEVQVI